MVMTKAEMTDILNCIYNCYPNFAYGKDPADVARTWYEFFKSMEYEKVDKKLREWIMHNDKPPMVCNLIVEDDWMKRYVVL